jgi:hypothetical protein
VPEPKQSAPKGILLAAALIAAVTGYLWLVAT